MTHTSTGIWAIDFADEYPDCQVVGTDISPIQPTWVPPNCRFEIEDATKPWTFAPESFDFIHMRYMYGSVADWDALFAEMYRATKPGGWVETMEPSSQFESENNTVVPGTALYEWGKVFYEAGRKSGRTFSVVEDGIQEKGLTAAGFVDVKVIEGKVGCQTYAFQGFALTDSLQSPLNGYMKEKKWKDIGMYSQVAFEQDIEGYTLFIFTRIMGWTPEQTRVYAAAFRKQLRDPNCHPYFRYKVVIGRKPEKPEKAVESTT
jgi:SAM-dependent methyltransferase